MYVYMYIYIIEFNIDLNSVKDQSVEGVENFVRCVDNLFTIVVNVEFNNGIYPAFIESLLFNSGNLIIGYFSNLSRPVENGVYTLLD